VYNVTSYVDGHPGGRRILLSFAGQDATTKFSMHHNVPVVLKKYEKLVIGTLKDSEERVEEKGADLTRFGDQLLFGKYEASVQCMTKSS
jgi:cytochrome b involved in lipid metabolism